MTPSTTISACAGTGNLVSGGRYIGTQDMVIVRDPEQGWVNMVVTAQ